MSLSLLVPVVLLVLCVGIAASEANSAAAVDSGTEKAAETPKQKKVESATFAMG